MINRKTRFILIGLLSFAILSCKVHWSKAIQRGSVASQDFHETVKYELRKGLIFVPVTIKGKKYRFLFDSGAPFSISNKIQAEYGFKVVSASNIVDSDENRKKVEWCEVDSFGIGDIWFSKQSAFVGDFEANPVLACLEIDGILGSNIIRQGFFTIDPESNTLTISSALDIDTTEVTSNPFKGNSQFSMFIDLNIAEFEVQRTLVDYGFNGFLEIDSLIYDSLQQRELIGKTWVETGMEQSGVIGKAVEFTGRITSSESVRIGNLSAGNTIIFVENESKIGNRLLSRFKVTIDWQHKLLHFAPIESTEDTVSLAGFKLGYADEGVYVMSVIENTDAFNQGMRPNMRVIELDNIVFDDLNSYCDYVFSDMGDPKEVVLVDDTGDSLELNIKPVLMLSR